MELCCFMMMRRSIDDYLYCFVKCFKLHTKLFHKRIKWSSWRLDKISLDYTLHYIN
eukprot:gene8387-5875_t